MFKWYFGKALPIKYCRIPYDFQHGITYYCLLSGYLLTIVYIDYEL